MLVVVFVFDLDEEEAFCGCCGAGGVSVSGGEDLGDGVGGDATGSGFDEGADEIANHVVEEACACDAVDEEGVVAAPGGLVNGAMAGGRGSGFGSRRRLRGFHGSGGQVGVVGGEGGEVVGAADVVCGVLEGGEVEGKVAVPDVGGPHGGADFCG